MTKSNRLPNGLTPEQDAAFAALARKIAEQDRVEQKPDDGTFEDAHEHDWRFFGTRWECVGCNLNYNDEWDA